VVAIYRSGGHVVADDDDDKPPNLKLVSENPNARAERQIAWAKAEVERTVALFAAAFLRTMAGSNSESVYLLHRLSDFLDALNKFREEAGRGLTVGELETALRLPQTEYVSSRDEWRHRQWIRDDGMDTIVKGALRLAAHKILGEEPHFGGKYSEDVIHAGIKTLEELKEPASIARLLKETDRASSRDDMDDGPTKSEKRAFGDRFGSGGASAPSPRRKQDQGFSQQDLKDLRKAIKANDKKKIAELTAKIGKPSFKE
jgi:hypothetical protein